VDTLAPPPVGTDNDTLVPAIPLAAGVGIFVTVGTFFASQGERVARSFDAGTVALIAIASVALAFRRRAPVPVLLAVFATVLVYELLGYANGPMWLFLVVALLNAVIRGHRWPAAVVVLLGFAIFPWLDRLLRDGHSPSFASVAALAAWLLVLFGVGEAIRIRRERAAETVRIREEEALRRASEERLRIARELHDALGHHLSLISVQAGVALHVNETLPDEVRGSLSAIKDASKEALTELRSVLEILRQDGERAPRSPMSTLARLDELIAQARAAGIDVHAETEGDVRPLPFGADVAAYRIVQEALTNVLRHAKAHIVHVRVVYGDEALTVEVVDDGATAGVPATSGRTGGAGIAGMRERVAALGGELSAGLAPGGGFRVMAEIPTARTQTEGVP
jgi:signal transduction histidine kinase